METKLLVGTHPSDEVLENYSFGRLPENDAIALEDHLLVCEVCQSALDSVDEYIALMKAATAELAANPLEPIPPAAPSIFGRFWAKLGELWRSAPEGNGVPVPRFGWNATFAGVLLMTCVIGLTSWNSNQPALVNLNAYRGGDSPLAHAPAGRALELKMDVTGLPEKEPYHVEVVTKTGERAWSGNTPAYIKNGVKSGIYWVRLYSASGQFLREFGFVAG